MSDELAKAMRQITELSGRMTEAHAELHRMVVELAIVGATVRALSPGGQLVKLRKPRRANRSPDGISSRIVLDAIRRADGPLTAAQIGTACGCTESRALQALRYHRRTGMVQDEHTPGTALVWRIAG